MGFIVKNDAFCCEWCGAQNPPAPKTCRNHCRICFASKHVDDLFPGDRQSVCAGKMTVDCLEISSDYQFIIHHRCEKCSKTITNKAAEDDNIDYLMEMWKAQADTDIRGK